jgi:hypothetical protein
LPEGGRFLVFVIFMFVIFENIRRRSVRVLKLHRGFSKQNQRPPLVRWLYCTKQSKRLRHGRSTCVAKIRKRYASLLLPSPQILEEWKL